MLPFSQGGRTGSSLNRGVCFAAEMESTGVYRIPAYEILEQYGFEVILVNAGYAKNVPRRAWLRQLHSYGLLRGSFRPDAEIATQRAYPRQRERLVECAAAHTVRAALQGVLGVDYGSMDELLQTPKSREYSSNRPTGNRPNRGRLKKCN